VPRDPDDVARAAQEALEQQPGTAVAVVAR